MNVVSTDYSNTRPAIRADVLPNDGPSRERIIELRANVMSSVEVYPLVEPAREALRNDEATLQSALDRGVTDEKLLKPLRDNVAASKAVVDKLKGKVKPLTTLSRLDRELYSSVARFINGVASGSKTLKHVPAQVPKGADLGTWADKSGEVSVEIQRTEAADWPLDLRIQEMLDRTENGARHGAPQAIVSEELTGPHANARFRSVLNIVWPMKRLEAAPLGDDLVNTIDVENALLWAFKDQIQLKLKADLEAAYADFDGLVLTPEEKMSRLKELRAEKLAVERVLAELIWQRREAGEDVPFPSGISPEAVLAVGF